MPQLQFVLKCPQCGNSMKYAPMNKTLAAGEVGEKTKQCVYCGKTFKIRENILKQV